MANLRFHLDYFSDSTKVDALSGAGRIAARSEARPARTGGVRIRRESAVESGRSDDQGVELGSIEDARLLITRRHFFGRTSAGLGAAALTSLLAGKAEAADGLPGLPHFPPTAKRVIYLFQHGAPSQLDLFDYKPGSAGASRHGAAGFDSHGPAPDRNDGVSGEVSDRSFAVQIRAARTERGVAQ